MSTITQLTALVRDAWEVAQADDTLPFEDVTTLITDPVTVTSAPARDRLFELVCDALYLVTDSFEPENLTSAVLTVVKHVPPRCLVSIFPSARMQPTLTKTPRGIFAA